MSVRLRPLTREIDVSPAVAAQAAIAWLKGRVPWTEQATVALRRLGWAVPAPIRVFYDWNGHRPFAHQKEIAAFCTLTPAGFVLADPGLGKTAAVLWAFDWLKRQGVADVMVVVAPLSVLSVWTNECAQWTPERRAVLVHGTRKKREQVLARPADIYVVNPDGVVVIGESLQAKLRDKRWVLVLDETTYYRNPTSDRRRAVRSLVRACPPAWMWGLTGTPLPERLEDAFGQVDLFYPGKAGRSLTAFRMRYLVKVGLFNWVPRPGAVDEVAALFDPAVRYARADCLDLPPTMTRSVTVPMGAKQQKVYMALVKHMRANIDNIRSTSAANAAVLLGKLLQVSAGWVKVQDGSAVQLDNQAQIEWVVDYVKANARKVLIANMFRAGVTGWCTALRAAGIEAAELSGSTPAAERAAIIRRFQTDPTLRVIVLQPQAAAHGITLTEADSVIWTSAPFSNELYTQTNARIVRPGQTARTAIVHLITAPVERTVFNAVIRKQKLQEALLRFLEGEDGNGSTDGTDPRGEEPQSKGEGAPRPNRGLGAAALGHRDRDAGDHAGARPAERYHG